jgi:predicted N-acetyltransferase YhbS
MAMVRYRWARPADRAELLDLIAAGFTIRPDGRFDSQQGREYRVLFTYLYSRPTWQPEWVVVAETNRRMVAAVGFIPQQLNLGTVILPVWAVSPVVVHSDEQGQGYGGNCLTQALAFLRARGIPAVFLWGIPNFYPKFGFVPLLPRYKTRLAKERFPRDVLLIPGKLRPLETADLPAIAALYERRAAQLWLQPQRTRQWWAERVAEMDCEMAELKEVPFPKKGNFLIWENLNSETTGYLYYTAPVGRDPLMINEAAALDGAVATAMLAALLDRYVPDGETVVIRGTPEHYLNLAAYRCGGTHLNPAPWAGMLKVLDWTAFCSQIQPAIAEPSGATEKGKRPLVLSFRSDRQARQLQWTAAGLAVTAAAGATPVLTEAQLTRLFFGLTDTAEWDALFPQTQAWRQLFPSRHPFIWDANYLY